MELEDLGLNNMNLSYFNFNVLQRQQNLKRLNLSNNHLKGIDLTFLKIESLNELCLEGNDLTEINNLTESCFPDLRKLSISRLIPRHVTF